MDPLAPAALVPDLDTFLTVPMVTELEACVGPTGQRIVTLRPAHWAL